jgi:photosystem II stability/assembly factor-like uncharacterized protein
MGIFKRLKQPLLVSHNRRLFAARMFVETLEDRTLLSWTPIGPAPILNGQTPGNMAVTGRLTGIATDPNDADIIYVAAASGGIWKTTDGGTTWNPLTDGPTVNWGGVQPVTHMGAVALAHSNPDIIYAGTGEGNFSGDSFYGRGVLKSTDAGATWTLMGNSVFNRYGISKIAIQPNDPNTVYVTLTGSALGLTANRNLWRTTDGGVTWSAIGPFAGRSYTDIAIDRTDPTYQTLFLAAGTTADQPTNGLYKSTDGGASWALVPGLPNNNPSPTNPDAHKVGRISVAVSKIPFFADIVYVSIAYPAVGATSGNLYKVERSFDGGNTWADITPSINYMGQQGWYDQTITIDPINPFHVIVAGQVRTLETFTAGFSRAGSIALQAWTDISAGADGNGPHVDHHAGAYDAEGRFLDGNDGGIWRLDNPIPGFIRWSDLNGANGTALSVTTFVGVAQDPTNINNVYGGSQDNGREQFSGSPAWNRIRGGDGGFYRIDPSIPTTQYGEFFGNSLERSDDGGATWTSIRPLAATGGNFYQPFVLDPVNTDITGHHWILDGSAQLWLSTDGGTTWTAMGTPGVAGFNPAGAPIDSIATQDVLAGATYASAGGHIFVTTNAGVSWTDVTPAGPLAIISGIYAAPMSFGSGGDAFFVHTGFGAGLGKVFWTTTNGSAGWANITFNLPNVPAWSVALNTSGTGTLYVGTDNNAWELTDPVLGPWTPVDSGLPTVQVHTLDFEPSVNVLTAGTYGRGAFQEIFAAPSLPPSGGSQFQNTSVSVPNPGGPPIGIAPSLTLEEFIDDAPVDGGATLVAVGTTPPTGAAGTTPQTVNLTSAAGTASQTITITPPVQAAGSGLVLLAGDQTGTKAGTGTVVQPNDSAITSALRKPSTSAIDQVFAVLKDTSWNALV